MTAKIRLESIASEPPVEIMQAEEGPVNIGRGPDNHIVVDSEAVSRLHASLLSTENFWVYRDYESTNGSWINGVRLIPGQLKIIRHGDVIQLADFPMRVKEVAPRLDKDASEATVVVFYDNGFEAEFVLTSPGERFAIGGPNAQFYLEGVSGEEPQLEISNNGWRLDLTANSFRVPVILNNMAATGISTLNDRDEVAIGPYRILISDLRTASPEVPSFSKPGAGSSPQARGGIQAYDRPHAPEHLRGDSGESYWESEAARRKASSKKFVFGTSPEQEETTNTLGLGVGYQSGTGYEMSTSQRFSKAVFDAESRPPNPMLEMLITLFGIFIFLIVLAVGVYFFVFMI